MGNKQLVSPCLVQNHVLRTTGREKEKKQNWKKMQSLDLQFSIFSGNLQCYFHTSTSSIPPLHFSSSCYRVCIRKQAQSLSPWLAQSLSPLKARLWVLTLLPDHQPDLLLSPSTARLVVESGLLSITAHSSSRQLLPSVLPNLHESLWARCGRWLSLEMIPATRPPATQSPL